MSLIEERQTKDWKRIFTDIKSLPRTSGLTIKKLNKLGIFTFWDLLNYFPLRYEDFSRLVSVGEAEVGDKVSVAGRIVSLRQDLSKRGLRIQIVDIQDESGDKIALIWFNQPYILRTLKKNMLISASGEVKSYFFQKALFVEEFEIVKSKDFTPIHTQRIVPYYSERGSLSSRVIREKIFYLLQDVAESFPEVLPDEIIIYNKLLPSVDSYLNIHFPQNRGLYKKARDRLAFDEIFFLQLSGSLMRKKWEQEKTAPNFSLDEGKKNSLAKFIHNLPFKLTSAQKKAVDEVIGDMQKSVAMNRFLQGDVGSGKTIVAVIASYFAYLNGFQTLVMAPTEVLAVQHHKSFENFLSETGAKIALQTGSIKSIKDYEEKAADFDIVIGTHALFNQRLEYKKVGLVIIDEQQRFGVMQRALLRSKGISPHLLTMTATPIPRTIALVLFGELNLSILDEMPKGRKKVKTFFVPPEKRESAYEWIREKISRYKQQVYVVCPLIEESEHESLKNVRSAVKEFERIKNIFPEFSVGLLHGRMKPKEKNQILQDFKDHKLDILVSTSVIEVGIDVPNATIMVIEAAERYGLAQLHQLRGRVGRSEKQSYCFVFSESSSKDAAARLRFFAQENNGFRLSEYDLKRRGPGEVYGLRQHGYFNVKFASLLDKDLIEKARSAVDYFLKNFSLSDFALLQKIMLDYEQRIVARD